MADPSYIINQSAQFDDENIRKLQTKDPANANTVFNPLFQKILDNAHALYRDKLNTSDFNAAYNADKVIEMLNNSSDNPFAYDGALRYAKNGTVHELTAAWSGGGEWREKIVYWTMGADYKDGDTWTLNGSPVEVTYYNGHLFFNNSVMDGETVIGVFDGSSTIRLMLDEPSINKNMLDNWYFLNPVNSRGQNSYDGELRTGAIDRWMSIQESNVAVTAEGIVVTAMSPDQEHAAFSQYFDARNFEKGEPITLSMLAKCSVGAKCGVYGNWEIFAEQEQFDGTGNFELITRTINYNPGDWILYGFANFLIPNSAEDATLTIAASKMEAGSRQTLAHKTADEEWVLDEIPSYAEEYAKCELYKSPNDGEFNDAFIGSQHSNPNLLDNWCFTSLINQRGQTSYDATGICFDRWNIDNCIVEILPKGVNLKTKSYTADGVFSQNLEADWFKGMLGQKITVSVLTSDGLLTGTGTIPATLPSPSSPNTIINIKPSWSKLRMTVSLDSSLFRIRLAGIWQENTNGTMIYAAKMELGARQTLARTDGKGGWSLNDPPPNKALELAKCQRYLYIPTLGNAETIVGLGVGKRKTTTGGTESTNFAGIVINVPVPMRSNPVISHSGNWAISGVIQRSLDFPVKTIAPYAADNSQTNIYVDCTVEGDVLKAGSPYILRAANDHTAKMIISTEL